MRLVRLIVICLIAEALLLAFASTDQEAAQKGKAVFDRRCSGCHATDVNKEGPHLRGVYGRKAASAPGYTYSDSLKKLNLRWDDASLDQWLSDPDALARDTDMAFQLNAPDERKAVIAYLKSLTTR
jgi:cytochrome c